MSPHTYGAYACTGTGAGSVNNYLQADVTPPPVPPPSVSEQQINRINWLLAKNFTSDPKYSSQNNFGEVHAAVWQILGYTPAEYNAGINAGLLSDNATTANSFDNFNPSAVVKAKNDFNY